jgi:hypothetical protein
MGGMHTHLGEIIPAHVSDLRKRSPFDAGSNKGFLPAWKLR